MGTIKRHTLFWIIVYLLWVFMKSAGVNFVGHLPVILINITIYMSVFYILWWVLIPRLYRKGKMIAFGASLLATTAVVYTVWRILGALWLDYIIGGTYLLETVQSFVPAMALLAWESYNEQVKEFARRQKLEKENIASELKLLKAQINPHFLFNTLNSLYTNVVNKSPEAPDMIMRLSGILDYVLYKSQKSTVLLKEEVETIKHFIRLEKIRQGDHLQTTFTAPDNGSLTISPLVLLSLIQQVFKQDDTTNNGTTSIKVDINTINETIRCEVWKDKLQNPNNSTIIPADFFNIKKQLQLIYPEHHELHIEQDTTRLHVLLHIKPAV